MLSIIIPTIRPQNQHQVYLSLKESCSVFNIIFVGPELDETVRRYDNISFIQDNGNPTECLKLGLISTKTDLVCYGVDDAFYYPNALDSALHLYQSICTVKDAIGLRYTEDYQHRPIEYWNCEYHDDLRLGPIRHMQFSPILLVNTQHLKSIGGISSTEYFHCNMGCIAQSLQLQRLGGKLYFSPEPILNVKWNRGDSADHQKVHNTELQHDIPLFKEQFSSKFPETLPTL
jgi:hypothetical protein